MTDEPSAGGPRARLRSLLTVAAVAPVRPWFNRWFQSLSDHVAAVGDNVVTNVNGNLERVVDEKVLPEATTTAERFRFIAETIMADNASLTEALQATDRRVARIERAVLPTTGAPEVTAPDPAPAAPPVRAHADIRRYVGAPLEAFDGDAADVVNWANSATGPLDEGGVYFNHCVSTGLGPGTAFVGSLNERVVEHPFVHRALADLRPGSRILDVGAAESTVAVELASRGFRTTALDPRPYPIAHPNLEIVTGTVEDWPGPSEPLDAVVALSSIEHFGLGHYVDAVDEDLDRRALERIRSWLAPGAPLVLTVPVGRWQVDDFQRVYDQAHLDRLLEGWKVHVWELYERVDRLTWRSVDDGALAAGWSSDDPGVALLVCRSEQAAVPEH